MDELPSIAIMFRERCNSCGLDEGAVFNADSPPWRYGLLLLTRGWEVEWYLVSDLTRLQSTAYTDLRRLHMYM
jgi:hypothetical protein